DSSRPFVSMPRLRLAGDDTVPTLRARHADYYLELAEKGDVELRGSDQVGWLDRLEVEHDNLRAALAWSETLAGDADFRIRLAGALGWFWRLRSHFNEGRSYLRSAIASSQKVTPRALIGAGLLAFAQGD